MLKKYRVVKIIIAILLIFCFTVTNCFTLLSTLSFAESNELGKQFSNNTSANVEYDVNFVKDNELKGYECEETIDENNLGIYLKVEVKNEGYLKNAKVLIESDNGLSFNISNEEENIKIEDNVIELDNINANEKAELIIPITYKQRDDINNLNKIIKVKLLGTYVNNSGKENGISEDVNLRLIWKMNTEYTLSSKVEKYIPYEKGIIAQTSIKSSIPENNSFVEKENIEIDALKINDYKIEKVSIVRKTGEELPQNNWKYDAENNKIIINLENSSESIKSDEYLITYILSGNEKLEMPLKINSKLNGSIFMFGNDEEISTEKEEEYEISEKIGDIVTFNSIPSESVKIGKLIANKYAETDNYETKYENQIIANISATDLVEGILIKDLSEEFENENERVATNSYYKIIKISKENFEKILGTDGKIEIINQNQQKLAEINANSQTDDQNNYFVTFENKETKLDIKTTAPVSEGNLILTIEKEITNTEYSVEQLKTFSNIDMKYEGNILYVQNVVDKVATIDNKIRIDKPQTKVDFTISRNTLSTIAENKDIEFKINFNNISEDVDLYKNPKFKLVLPEYIENIEVTNVAVANNEDVFNISEANIDKDEKGRIVINIALEGLQTKYNLNKLANGTNIIIRANMILNIYTPSKKEKVELYYFNENATSYAKEIDGAGYEESEITLKAPVGMVSVNKISNYNNLGNSIVSVSQGKVTDKIEIFDESKVATMDILVMNNNENSSSDIKILGRIPFKGNKDVKTGKDLGTTIDTTLENPIIENDENLANATIYYSTNGEATEDIENASNGWTTDISNLGEYKSYLIVVNNYEMKPGEILRYSYQYRIPANLEHNTDIYGSFEVIYNDIKDVAVTKETSSPDIVGLTTGVGTQIEAKITKNIQNSVKEYEKIKYTLEIQNTGSENAEDVKVKVKIPDGATYATYTSQASLETSKGWALKSDREFEKTIKLLEAGKTQKVEFFVQANKLPTIEQYYANNDGFTKNDDGTYSIHESYIDENGEEKSRDINIEEIPEINLVCEASISAKDLAKELVIKDEGTKVEKSNLITEEIISSNESIAKVGETVESKIYIKNNSSEKMNNIIVTKEVPEGLTYKESYIRGYEDDGITLRKIESKGYNEINNTITWEIESIDPGRTAIVVANLTVDKMKENVYQDTISTITNIKANDEEYQAGQVNIEVGRPNLVADQNSTQTNKYVKVGDEIEYIFNIKNTGSVAANDVALNDLLPDEVEIKKLVYTVDGIEVSKVVTENSDATVYTSIQPNNEMEVKITTKVTDIDSKQKTITNVANLKAADVAQIKTNAIENIIERTGSTENTSNSNNSGTTPNSNGQANYNNSNVSEKIKQKYEITGTAWLDENKNGVRDNNEEKLSGIEVKLINTETNTTTATNVTTLDGEYKFENLDNGEYQVIFYYDNIKYGLTDYKKQSIADNMNSDVISVKEGNKDVATSDIIKIQNGSKSGIDIGLIKATKFDLALEKSITKVTVQHKDGTKSYDFNDEKLAKVDINAKYLSDAKVYVEYTFTIKNEGEIEGYAKNIVDYVPSDLEFSTELNKNWYKGNDGNLYTEELANTPIQPGEAKKVKLILVKTMTEENTGIVNNQAEIAQSYNKAGIADNDSEANNKEAKEDDMSSADLIIGVETGDTLIYFSVAIIIAIATIITAIVMKKKKVILKLQLKFRKEV